MNRDQLETSAAKHLGTRINEAGIYYFLNKLFNPSKGRGLLIRPGEHAVKLRELVQNTYNYVSGFFNNARTNLANWDDTQKRIHTPFFC